MHDFCVLLEECDCRNHRITTPVRAGGGDDIVRLCPYAETAFTAAAALALAGVGYVFIKMRLDGAHTDLVAEVADSDIEHAFFTKLVKQQILLGFVVGYIKTGCVMIATLFVCAGALDADYGGRIVFFDQFVRHFTRLFGVLGKADNTHRNRHFTKGFHIILEKMKADASRKIFDGDKVFLGTDNDRLDIKRLDKRTAKQNRADNTVGFGVTERTEHKACHDKHKIAGLQGFAKLFGSVHAKRLSDFFS